MAGTAGSTSKNVSSLLGTSPLSVASLHVVAQPPGPLHMAQPSHIMVAPGELDFSQGGDGMKVSLLNSIRYWQTYLILGL